MNLTVPSLGPGFEEDDVGPPAPFVVGDVTSVMRASLGVDGDLVACFEFLPFVVPLGIVAPLVSGRFSIGVLRGSLFADASWFSVMRMLMYFSIGCPEPTIVEFRWWVYSSSKSSSVSERKI